MTENYNFQIVEGEETKIEISLKDPNSPVRLDNLLMTCYNKRTGSEEWIKTEFIPAKEAEIAKQRFLMKYQ